MGQIASTLALVREIRPTGNGWHSVDFPDTTKGWSKPVSVQKWKDLLRELVHKEKTSPSTMPSSATTPTSTTTTSPAPDGDLKCVETKDAPRVLPRVSGFNHNALESLFNPVYDPKPRAGQDVYLVHRMGSHLDRPAILVKATLPASAVVGEMDENDGGFSLSAWVPKAFALVEQNTPTANPKLASGWKTQHDNKLEELVVGLGEEQHDRVVFSEGVSGRYRVSGVEKAFSNPDAALRHGVQGLPRTWSSVRDESERKWQWVDTTPPEPLKTASASVSQLSPLEYDHDDGS